MKLKIVRLHSGEELLTRVEETEEGVTLSKALIIIPYPQGGLNFQMFMPYSKAFDGLFVPKQYVAFMVDPDETLTDHYEVNIEKKVKIEVPDRRIILG